jgi:hypothetical protein
MMFKKNGRLYGNIELLLNECCQTTQYCFQCALHGKVGTKSCTGYAAENPEEVARLLDAAVIKDKPITAEAVEHHGEDVKPKRRTLGASNSMDKMAEYVEKYLEGVKTDPVNRPAHYTSGGIKCIAAMQAAFGDEAVKDFCLCNCFKYLWRHRQKNGVEDLKKARWYLNRLITEMEVEDDESM